MTYRAYLFVLVAVVAITQTTVAVQQTAARRDALVASAARPAPSVPVEVLRTAPVAAAGGVERRPVTAPLASAPQVTAPPTAAPLAAAPPVAPAHAIPSAAVAEATDPRHDVPCDTTATTADTCVAPSIP